ncbi:error-prone DNA polymerase [Pandoraea apista]|uniref:Error-prone DNA polymerase n=1 Tax=Pandoraea apista TaxID=93218 RepID=A0ABX9ZJS5_9BURK|nr:error-prone DNA polymerase [Pandoraea apista]PTE00139.1 error-prone DNA polymerase [Pandoraea apista]RRJ28078.1 error-prone DNA polymerase [Pandoraea apista]RRJ73604.1 error-prone DNA polymerase [Pandoraea apista]RSD06751.1 error-prone DNA polymerase [Pandoraea apista]RSD12423.1 error-prone DNA polymerase [Pandoraea apista]
MNFDDFLPWQGPTEGLAANDESAEPADPRAADDGSLPAYAELHCLSNFSFQRGASHPEELIARAAYLGYTALAITDECSLAGVVRALAEGVKHPAVSLIVGSEFRLTPEREADTLGMVHLVALAQHREGYGNLSEMITLGRMRGPKRSYRLHTLDFSAPASEQAHLRGLPGCLMILVPDADASHERTLAQTRWAAQTFGEGRVWLALERRHRADDEAHLARLRAISAECGVPLVATGHVLMHVRSRKPLQDTLTAIGLGKPVQACGLALAANAEQHLRTRLRLAWLYPSDTLAETVAIASRCHFDLRSLRYEYPEELVPAGHTPVTYLRQEVEAGAKQRYPNGLPQKVRDLIEDELTLIGDLEYEPYFLTVYDIVRYARSQNILCQGRGSAANSAVCYCLGITAVNPDEVQLLFGRFLSRERKEPPDIDVDFEHQRREEVIQYIYRKYGTDRAALAATVISYRMRSAVRDTGRALGIDLSIVEQIAQSQQWWDGRENLLARMAAQGLSPDAPTTQLWADLVARLIGFPRHLSQHVGGFVISRDRLSRLVPIAPAAMEDRYVIQWDKDDIETLKLLKVDVLALGMLSALRRTLDLLGEWRGAPMELADIPRDDPATYGMIRRADTIGVFQIESRAQMSMLPRLKPDKFYDLVIEVAIVRPGPIQGGMVHPYLRRKQGKEEVIYPREEIKAALERTLGVPIFQEQVMQIAMIAADFTPGDADQLRRSMAAWKRKGGLEKFQTRIISGMLKNGYPQAFAEAICRQIEGFGEYGFPESHAASFALLAYASAWLKCHAPEMFLCGLLNSLPMGFYSASQLVQDARRHRVEVRAIDVCVSDVESRPEARTGRYGNARRPAVRLGLSLVRGLSDEGARAIERARRQRPFTDIDDLTARATLSRRDLDALAAADALSALLGGRRQARWTVAAWQPPTPLLGATALRDAVPGSRDEQVSLPPMPEGQDIVADYASTGLTLRRHPLLLLREKLTRMRVMTAKELQSEGVNGHRVRTVGIVTGRQRPGTANGTVFVSLEDETGVINVIVWPDLVESQRKALLAASLLGVEGVWQREARVTHLVAHRLVDLSPMLGELAVSSRNFH